MKKKFRDNPAVASVLASISSIILGLIFGYLMLIIFNPSKSGKGIQNLLFTGLASKEKFAKVLYQAAPLIMTGLSVGFAYKTGLFNIGLRGSIQWVRSLLYIPALF